jgi:hypothetical protein
MCWVLLAAAIVTTKPPPAPEHLSTTTKPTWSQNNPAALLPGVKARLRNGGQVQPRQQNQSGHIGNSQKLNTQHVLVSPRCQGSTHNIVRVVLV